MENALQIIGLVIAVSYVIFSLDDLIWDIFSIRKKLKNGDKDRLPLNKLDNIPPKLLAVMIAAWHEENVLEQVIDNMIASMQYPRCMYHVFLGVYPNDLPTLEAAKRLEAKYENVHTVINVRSGPTNKADNLNNIIRNIKQFENARNWRFTSVTVHDSEDVIHPYELKITNYLIDRHQALQFPVIPLQKMPTLKGLFRGMTTGTYADEFAENHYRIMGTREAMSAMVPSAGTGFVLSRNILDYFGDSSVFPEDSLTEDYKLSLILAKEGFKVHYVLEKLPRLLDDNTVKWDYVATRSFFPDTFRAAVRQKTRWIYGITMQSIKGSDLLRGGKMGFAGRYSLYKDLKAKAGNILVFPGYLVFLYFIASLFIKLPDIYPFRSFAWYLCVLLTFLMLFRQTMRAIAITNFYGYRSMMTACLLPPLMPVRLIWGNIINMSATLKAWKLFLTGRSSKRKAGKTVWNKTDHTFLDTPILYRYYRKVGDVLLEKQYINVSSLRDALIQSRKEEQLVGEFLLRKNLVTEEHLMSALANIHHRIYLGNTSAIAGSLSEEFDKEVLRRLLACPLFKVNDQYVFARTDSIAADEIASQLGISPDKLLYVYSTRSNILSMLDRAEPPKQAVFKDVTELTQTGEITWEQAVLALNNHNYSPDILKHMGLRNNIIRLEPVRISSWDMEANA